MKVKRALTGAWYQIVNNRGGGFSYFADRWSPNWQVFVTDLNADRRSDLLLYNTATGQWFQCLNLTLGKFSYTNGKWDPGLSIVAATMSVP